jgi:hypothetical protein
VGACHPLPVLPCFCHFFAIYPCAWCWCSLARMLLASSFFCPYSTPMRSSAPQCTAAYRLAAWRARLQLSQSHASELLTAVLFFAGGLGGRGPACFKTGRESSSVPAISCEGRFCCRSSYRLPSGTACGACLPPLGARLASGRTACCCCWPFLFGEPSSPSQPLLQALSH